MLGVIKIMLTQYGAGAGAVVFIAFILYYTLKFAKENIKTIMDQAREREKEQRVIIEKQQIAVRDLAKEIRGVRRANTRDHAKMSRCLDEIAQALGRINGYKK